MQPVRSSQWVDLVSLLGWVPWELGFPGATFGMDAELPNNFLYIYWYCILFVLSVVAIAGGGVVEEAVV